MVWKRILLIVPILLFLIAPVWAQPAEIKIGVLAKRGSSKALERWEPTAAYLQRSLPEYRFRIVPMTFDEIPTLVSNRLVDYVIVNPAIYVELFERYGVDRIATLKFAGNDEESVAEFGALFFTRKERTDLQELKDLRSATVAAVHETSLGGWIMGLFELHQAGMSERSFASLRFLDTHDAVVYGVEEGSFDAGIVRTATLERMNAEGKIALSQFRVIAPKHYAEFPFLISTRLYPEWPFARLSHVSGEEARQIAMALMRIAPEDEAAKAAGIKGWTIPEDYRGVEAILKALKLPPYEEYDRVSVAGVVKSYGYWLLLFLAGMTLMAVLWWRTLALNRSLKRQHDRLASGEEMFKGTFEQAAVGLLHASLDGELLRFNHKICAFCGYSPAQMRGMNLNDLIFPGDLAATLQEIEKIKSARQLHAGIRARLLGSEGNPLWADLTVSAVTRSDGRIKYMIFVVEDVGELKRLEHEAQSEALAKRLIAQMAREGVIVLDAAGRQSFVNDSAAAMLGYDGAEMTGRSGHELWHHSKGDGSRISAEECPILKVLRTGIPYREEGAALWRKDGSHLLADLNVMPIAGTEIAGAVIFMTPHRRPGGPL